MYENTKFNVLRFYLTSKRETSSSDEDDEQTLPDLGLTKSTTKESDVFDAILPDDKNDQDLLTQQEVESIIADAAMYAGIDTDVEIEMDAEIDTEINFRENIVGTTGSTSTPTPNDTVFYTGLPAKTHNITLHRGHFLDELNQAFKKVDPFCDIIEFTVILPNGTTETAEDSGGVTRDVLTEYWEAFYTENTTGIVCKIPVLRHDYGHDEWKSVAKIVLFGLKNAGYFPVRISAPFMEYCLYGSYSSNLLEAYFKMIPQCDQDMLKGALGDITSVPEEDLLDLLDLHHVKKLPNQDNLDKIIREVAHKEIIQESMYVIDCWRPILQHADVRPEQLAKLYDSLIPNARRVAQLFNFPSSMTQEEALVANHLKRLMRELDEGLLQNFLRFCTGSDLMVREKIEINFVNITGLARRPVAHTCTCMLELPKNYESFSQFRGEFLSVLKSGVWIMDII